MFLFLIPDISCFCFIRTQVDRVGLNEATIKWEDPTFSGAQPWRYRVYIRNGTRNFSRWTELYYPSDITRKEHTIHELPSGIACKFRVSAGNNGEKILS